MNRFRDSNNLSAPTSVHVEVKGSLTIPLNLGLLAELGDPMMEQEIIKEAVRIAVCERLGYFDGFEVRLSSSGGREGAPPALPNKAQQQQQQLSDAPTRVPNSTGQRYCEAYLDLDRLGQCIAAIQRAYEDVLAQAHVVQEVLNGTGPFAAATHGSPVSTASSLTQHPHTQTPTQAESCSNSSTQLASSDAMMYSCPSPLDASGSAQQMVSNNNSTTTTTATTTGGPAAAIVVPSFADVTQRLRTAQRMLDALLRGHQPDVVSEAAAAAAATGQREAAQLLHEAQFMEQQRAGDGVCSVSSHIDHEEGVDAELRRGLLAEDDEAEEEARMQQARLDDEDEDVEDDEGFVDADDNLDEETLHARYMRAGYTPL